MCGIPIILLLGVICEGKIMPRPPPTFSNLLLVPIFRTFLGDFNPQKLPSRRLQTLWEWKDRVLLEAYYIFNVVIPLEVE